MVRTKKISIASLGITSQPFISFITVFLIATLGGVFIEQNGYLFLSCFSGYAKLGGIPAIESSLWNWIDLTLGLLLVGIFEELVFRGYLFLFLGQYTRSLTTIMIVSAVAFGLIRWSGGLHKVIVTSLAGAVFMMLYLKIRSLPAIMLAHFAINFIDFAQVIQNPSLDFTKQENVPPAAFLQEKIKIWIL